MTNKESLLKQFIIFILIATIIEMVLLAFFHVGYLFVGAINIFVTLVYLICAIKNKRNSEMSFYFVLVMFISLLISYFIFIYAWLFKHPYLQHSRPSFSFVFPLLLKVNVDNYHLETLEFNKTFTCYYPYLNFCVLFISIIVLKVLRLVKRKSISQKI